ncbi:MAG: Tsi3 family protein [Pyrinomonadaceae bacterium]
MCRPVASSDKTGSLAPLLLLACALLCAACAPAGGQNPPPLKIVKESQHANGLVVGLPEGFDARPNDDGLVVEPAGHANREVRNPAVAYVSLGKDGEVPDVSPLQSKSVGGKEVRYRVTKSEGGSGGEVYTLEVYERVEGGHVRYTQATQSEMGEPDFALCWTLVGSTKYQPKNN